MTFKTNRPNSVASPTYNPPSPTNYEPAEFWEDEDADDYYDDAPHLAPIGGFDYFKPVDEIVPKQLLSAEEIRETISLGNKLYNANPLSVLDIDSFEFFENDLSSFIEIIESNLTNDQVHELIDDDEKTVEKFLGPIYEYEADHDFHDSNLTRMVFESIKHPVRQAIINKKINVNLFTNGEDSFFLQREIINLIHKNQSRFTSVKEALKLLSSDVQFILDIFSEAMKKFQKLHETAIIMPKSLINSISDLEFRKFINFDDSKMAIHQELLRQVQLVYIPSGGGKSTLTSRYPKLFYDVDKLVHDNNELFQAAQNYCKKHKKYKEFIMSKFFKFCVSKLDFATLSGKILLFNHPNQIPNCFKIRINELILIPTEWRIRTRFFAENLCSLLLVNRYVKKFCDQDDYFKVIMEYFQILK